MQTELLPHTSSSQHDGLKSLETVRWKQVFPLLSDSCQGLTTVMKKIASTRSIVFSSANCFASLFFSPVVSKVSYLHLTCSLGANTWQRVTLSNPITSSKSSTLYQESPIKCKLPILRTMAIWVDLPGCVMCSLHSMISETLRKDMA